VYVVVCFFPRLRRVGLSPFRGRGAEQS